MESRAISLNAPPSELDFSFIQGMADRMSMSYYKYGLVAEAYPDKVNALGSLQLRLQKYIETGNKEYLIDAANFAMIEFMCPKREGAYFKSTDSDGSPGRVWNGGSALQTANTTDRENVRLGGTKLTTAGGFYKKEGD